jgi:hypothetical protein
MKALSTNWISGPRLPLTIARSALPEVRSDGRHEIRTRAAAALRKGVEGWADRLLLLPPFLYSAGAAGRLERMRTPDAGWYRGAVSAVCLEGGGMERAGALSSRFSQRERGLVSPSRAHRPGNAFSTRTFMSCQLTDEIRREKGEGTHPQRAMPSHEGQRASTIVTLATPPASHMVWRP